MPRATSLTGAPRQVHLEVAGPDRDRRTYDPLGAFETILEHSPLKVIIFDRDLVIREVSRPAAELARMPREAMRGQTLRTDLRALLQERFELRRRWRYLVGPAMLIKARTTVASMARLTPQKRMTDALMLLRALWENVVNLAWVAVDPTYRLSRLSLDRWMGAG